MAFVAALAFSQIALANDDSPSVVADAGFDRHVSIGQRIQLDASRSLSANGQALSYRWSVVARPSGSVSILSDPAAVRPQFTIDVAGDYVFAVVVRARNGNGDKAAFARVTVSTNNVAPVADAGLNRRTAVGATVALDGARSFDADGDAITYAWTLIDRPSGSRAALSSAASVRPVLTLDVAGTYVAELVVADANGKRSAPARVALSTRDALEGRASAGPGQNLPVGATARFDADGTYLPPGVAASPRAGWALLSKPMNSLATLSEGPDGRQTLTLDEPGDYVAQVATPGAWRGDHNEADDHGPPGKASRFATALATTGNVPAVADAGPDRRVEAGVEVTLDGSPSTDVNGDLLAYRWSLISRPAGSVATLDDAHAVKPKFTADLAGAYVAQLVVDDGSGASRPATVVVATEPVAPNADAGPDPLAPRGGRVTLDGTASFDPNGEALAPTWTILGLGDNLPGKLTTPNGLKTDLEIPPEGIPLTRAVLSGSVTLPIKDEEAGDDRPRLSSVGRLTGDGATYTIWRIRNPTSKAASATLNAPEASFSQSVNVPARTDLFIASPANVAHRLSIGGDVVATIAPLSRVFADARLVGGGPALKLSILQLLVANRLLFDVDNAVVSTIEARPIAAAQASAPAYRAVAVRLDGSASINPNSPAAPHDGLSYRWALLSRPEGSHAQIANATNAVAGFMPDAYGHYVAQLIVSDGILASRPRTLVVEVASRPPVVAISASSPVIVNRVATLDGAGSHDPDGDALTYAWTLTKPSGSRAALTSSTTPTTSFTPDVAGTYVAQLIVSDGSIASAPATASIAAEAGFAFTPIGPRSVALGSRLAFAVSATDPAGRPVVYSIVGSLPPGASFDAATGAFRFRPTSNVPPNHSFAFRATNGADVATLTVPVTVTGEPNGTTAALTAQLYDAVDYANGTLTPVAGATVSSGGVSATSAGAGTVTLSGLPPGQVALAISANGAAPAPDGSRYLDTATSASLIAGVTNTLDAPVLLARSSGGTGINPGGATTVSNSALGVTLTIPQSAAFNADGTPYTGEVSIGSLPSDTPAGLPAGFAPCQLLVVSPAGVIFNPPAKLTVANRDQLPAGALVDLWAFDPQLATARVVGVGQVSTDGATIATIIGGVPGGTILAMAPHRPGLAQTKMQPTDMFVPSVLGGGDFSTSFSPPGVRQLNAGRGLTFVYHSTTADARPAIDAATQFGPNYGLPQTLTTKLTIAGVTQQTVLNTNLSRPLEGGAALDPTQRNAVMQAGIADATSLASGAYQYSFLTISRYACSAVGSQTASSFVVNNQSNSPFGAGWQLAELQKLAKQPDGSLAIVEGNGKALVAHPEQAPDFIPDPVYVPVNGPFRGATGDLTGLGNIGLVKLGWKDASVNVILNAGQRKFIKSNVFTVGQAGTQAADGRLTLDASDIALGDFNGDGVSDLSVITRTTQAANMFRGSPGGAFALTQNIHGVAPTNNAVAGDWIGTGLTHLMMAESVSDYDYHVLQNDGAGNLRFVASPNYLDGQPLSMTAVRFPGFAHDSVAGVTENGFLAYAYGGAAGGNLYTRGVGDSDIGAMYADSTTTDSLKLPGALPTDNASRILAAGDIDDSGAPSFAVAGTSAVYIVKWFGPRKGNQKVVQTLTLPGGLSPDSVTLAPLAKGNRASLIVTAKTAGFYVFPNDGKGSLATTPVHVATPFRTAYEAHAVDFDNDGYIDVAVNDIDNDRVAIYFGRPHADGAFVSPIGDYTRIVQNADRTYSRIYNDGTIVKFDKDGFQTTIVDANGNTTNYSYNSSGQLTQIIDPAGATTSFTYAGAWIASTTDGAGRTTSFEHDGAGNLTKVADPLGNVTQYLYDANHRLVTTISPNGGQTRNTYASTGQLKQQTYPDGASVKLDVTKSLGLDALGVDLGGPTNAAFVPLEARITRMQDAKGNFSETEVNERGAAVRVTDALGRVSRFYRDDSNRVARSEVPAGLSAPAPATAPAGRLASAAAAPVCPAAPTGTPELLVNEYVWDGSGNLVWTTEAVGNSLLARTTRHVYEPTHNKLIEKTDALGRVTRWSYDDKGNMIATTDALGGVVSYAYDARGLALTKTDQNGHVTSYDYDTSGNLARTTDALGNRFDRYYDGAGNLILSIDAAGTSVERRRSFLYDANNRLVSQTSATGQATNYAYDSNGNLTQITDPARNVTHRVYDGADRLLSETTPAAGTNSFTYDANGNRVTVTDASGALTTYGYDAANRLVSITDALNATRCAAYDLRDNVVAVTNARGKTTRFAYDLHKRLATRTTPASPTPTYYSFDLVDNFVGIRTPALRYGSNVYDALNRIVSDSEGERFTYDAASNLLTASQVGFGVSHSFAYDALNRMVSATEGGFRPSLVFSYGYDALSRRVAMDDGLGGVTRYAYDGEDRVASITTPWGGLITQNYDSAGRPERMTFPNGLDADLSYESATGRLAGIAHRPGTLGAPIAKFDHAYDIRGNLSALNEIASAKTFSYDPLERLTGVTRAAPAPATEVESYAYDPEGNRLVTHLSPAYVTDDADRVLDDGINAYAWGVDGEMQARTSKSGGQSIYFRYNAYSARRNQLYLTYVAKPTGPMWLGYDAFARLAWAQWPLPFAFSERHNDGPDMAVEKRFLMDGSFQWVRYVHGPRDDQPLAVEIYPRNAAPTPGTGSQFYYHADGEGSIRLLTTAQGQIANRYDYDSFGRRLSVVESLPDQPYGWKGREWFGDVALLYNRARWYDPVLGRFTSEDPLGYGGGDTNLYSFAWNNPVNWNDPSGLSPAAEEGQIDSATTRALIGDGVITTSAGGTGLASGAEAAAVARSSGSVVQRIGARIACVMYALDDVFTAINEPSIGAIVDVAMDLKNCRAKVKKKPPCRPGATSSFEAGALIETALGRRRIEDIAIGDLVAARDAFTGEINWRPVRDLFRRTAPSISRLTLDSPDGKREILSVTSEHPFFVEGKGWLEVRRLEKGDRIVSEHNALLAVAEVTHDDRPTLVYNFEVAQDHNYFVGDLGAEAHNGTRPLSDPTPTWLYQQYDKFGNFSKWGISIDPDNRYPPQFLQYRQSAQIP